MAGLAAWLPTLLAMQVVLSRYGLYGLVADAQNLIAIYGVIHVDFAQSVRRKDGRTERSSLKGKLPWLSTRS
jgi:hypothetical protein